jgi:hypothetical protein
MRMKTMLMCKVIAFCALVYLIAVVIYFLFIWRR